MRINDNIQTGIGYRSCLLFKRFYTAGLAWLSQGLGTKVLAWNKENRNRVRTLYAKDERIMVTWGQISMKQGCRDEGWNKGNRDEWRGVRDVTEIEQTWGWRRHSREKVVQDGLCQRPIGDPFRVAVICIPENNIQKYSYILFICVLLGLWGICMCD